MPISSYPPAVAGSWTELATSTISGNPSSVSFTSVSTSYSRLLLSWVDIYPNSTDVINLQVRLNNDTASNYSHASNNVTAYIGNGNADSIIVSNDVGQSSARSSGFLLITGANDIWKTMTFTNNFNGVGSSRGVGAQDGTAQWHSATAINRLDLFISTSSFAGGTVKLYGAN
jgi:hypothetical protein